MNHELSFPLDSRCRGGILLPMSAPEYVICINCETPCYVFEWNGETMRAEDVLCETCGSDDPAEFLTQSEWDED
jgi:hypothetical protein